MGGKDGGCDAKKQEGGEALAMVLAGFNSPRFKIPYRTVSLQVISPLLRTY
jgi:hypothetical protein